MNNSADQTTRITRITVPEEKRLQVTEDRFSLWFPLTIEDEVYQVSEHLTRGQYRGGWWWMYELSNGGFYMCPDLDQHFQVHCDNCWQGELSADALGITACLYAFSRLSYSENVKSGRLCAEHYYQLRDYMYEHPEAAEIAASCD